MNGTTQEIMDMVGCSETDAGMIEHIVREEIFHSTLDWQTAAQFCRAVRKATTMLEEDRETYEEFFRVSREAYQRLHAEVEAREKAIAYEI
jgi:hypothetical protein